MRDSVRESNTVRTQSAFLKGEIQFLTLQASLATRNRDFPIYAKRVTASRRTRFRKRLGEVLNRLAKEYDSGDVSYDEHYVNIRKLSEEMESQDFKDLLHKHRFRVGVAQKALNLYLKYLWCMGKIAEPPHCPFDNIIIGNLDNCDGINWTEFDDIQIYEDLVEKAKLKAGNLSVAEWELRVFNRR